MLLTCYYWNIAFVGHIPITFEELIPWFVWHAAAAYLTANTDWEWSPFERDSAIPAAVDRAKAAAIGTKLGFVTTLFKIFSIFSPNSNISVFCFGHYNISILLH